MINKMDLTKKERDTIIAVGNSGSNDFPLRLVDLSLLLKVKPPTALNLVRRLSKKGCLKDAKGMIIFTDKGKKAYMELVENHRVMETLMANSGMDPDKACILSENIDYLIDHISVDRVFDNLGKPKICPHGKKIEQMH